MKTLFVSLLLLGTYCSYSQIPNNSFEHWSIVEGIEEPDGWFSNNTQSHISVQKTIDAYSGDYAVEIISNGPSFEGTAPGWVKTTVFPETQFNRLSLYYKCDSLVAPAVGKITTASWINGSTNIVGAFEISQLNSMYELLTIPLSLNEIPDSLTISLTAKTINNGVAYIGYAKLKFDSIYLDYSTGINETLNYLTKIRVYPNPANTILTIDLPEETVDKEISFKLIDLGGMVISKGRINTNKEIINIQNISKGTYIIQLTSNDIFSNKKLIIN